MGYRAHVLTKNIVEYGSGSFNWKFCELSDFIREHCPSAYLDDGYGVQQEHWEIPKDEFKEMIKYIEDNYEDRETVFENYNKEDILTEFTSWLNQSKNKENYSNPDYIYIEWF